MLQYKTISSELLGLLKSLCAEEEFSNLRCVGGTSLALQLGHRKSVDIDLFGRHSLDKLELDKLLAKYGEVAFLGGSKSINVYTVDKVKVDIVNYQNQWIKEYIEDDGIRLARIEDIAAMKIEAISQRGSKKDFVDIYYILKKFTLRQILQFHTEQYKSSNEWIAIKSLTYFDDADSSPMPHMFSNITWEHIKRYIRNTVKSYNDK